jgi:leader peptidase (prepilin peptidase)/N-methyltransferase
MGMGDVKLAGVLGLFLGVEVIPGLLIAFLLGTLVGLVVIARKGAREGRKTAVPFGPFLAVGAVVALWVGADLVDFYKDNFL